MQPVVIDSGLLTRREAAAFLRVSPATLARWSWRAKPVIPFVRVGGRTMYYLDDLKKYLAANRCE